jgi:hypothetical protein
MAKAGLQIFSDLREQSDAPWEEAMLKPPTTENALIDRRGILRGCESFSGHGGKIAYARRL